MEWTRSETLALAMNTCTQCHGLGLMRGRGGSNSPCNCVLRAIFRVCYRRFQEIARVERRVSTVRLEMGHGAEGRIFYSRKDEEYLADFCLVAKRTLTEAEHDIFRFHFLLGADWKLCCRRLNVDRGTFFHAVYRIQQKLGRTFRDLQPYPLYPLADYFSSNFRAAEPTVLEPRKGPGEKLTRRVPVRKAA
jgi:hypothetical protein